ncbi:hypothetical protein QAD02_017663 [Eretmocerus hayati]|uniref:Uncharacterized protein n=1 Tax=Eretmocerus hayati TaxID=131215 RepID=A0ACC2PFR7_9HYME|nr:hypothetical protein QAD02_017663 [Eretmocerus hayati]
MIIMLSCKTHSSSLSSNCGNAIHLGNQWRSSSNGGAAVGRQYVNDLAEQMRRKQRLAQEERRREMDNCRRHMDTWSRLWGRPGHGAPADKTLRRNKLNETLYRGGGIDRLERPLLVS